MLTNAEVPGSSSAICSNALQQSEDGGPWTNVTLPSPTSVAVALTIPGLLHQFQYQVQVTGCDKVQSSWTQGQQFGYNLLQESNGQWHMAPPRVSGRSLSVLSARADMPGIRQPRTPLRHSFFMPHTTWGSCLKRVRLVGRPLSTSMVSGFRASTRTRRQLPTASYS